MNGSAQYHDVFINQIPHYINVSAKYHVVYVNRIPYYMSASRQYPGKFLISYLPRKSPKHEFVTVMHDGLRYRSQSFPSLSALIRWFKEHYREVPSEYVCLSDCMSDVLSLA